MIHAGRAEERGEKPFVQVDGYEEKVAEKVLHNRIV
jgi:hypothetical protein